jgi:hypothetical protein
MWLYRYLRLLSFDIIAMWDWTMRTAICMVCSGTQYPQCSRHGNTPLALI